MLNSPEKVIKSATELKEEQEKIKKLPEKLEKIKNLQIELQTLKAKNAAAELKQGVEESVQQPAEQEKEK